MVWTVGRLDAYTAYTMTIVGTPQQMISDLVPAVRLLVSWPDPDPLWPLLADRRRQENHAYGMNKQCCASHEARTSNLLPTRRTYQYVAITQGLHPDLAWLSPVSTSKIPWAWKDGHLQAMPREICQPAPGQADLIVDRDLEFLVADT